ncbi:beta-defensin 123-like [Nannospalax galili]|uniref:Beta-defensin n=1 Tax=Nannospalax galili TaxID=1026970 RepID=A0A8C6QRC7_NANGA|nr:beta-defensin 123-like [Nannospalax galili]
MQTLVLTLTVLLLLSQAVPGSTKRCWNSQGTCRDQCIKNEKAYIFCWGGKMCCVKPKDQISWKH